MPNDIQRIQPGNIQTIQAPQQQVPIQAMFQAVIEKGVTAENAAAIEKLCDLHLKLEGINARKAYARAMADMQAELPPIVKRNPVANKSGVVMYSYAKYEEMMAVIQPWLTKYGFSISCAQRSDEKQCVAILTITHSEGHSETSEFAVRHSTGTQAMSTAQIDASDSNLARRHALSRALNLRVVGEEDDDARNLGETISPEQAASLKRRLAAIGRDPARFLKFAGATSFEEIRSAKLPELEDSLSKAERAAKIPPTSTEASHDVSEPMTPWDQSVILASEFGQEAGLTEAQVDAIIKEHLGHQDKSKIDMKVFWSEIHQIIKASKK